MNVNDADFVSDLADGSFGDDVISANTGNIDTHRGSDTPAVVDKPAEDPNASVAEPAKPLSLRDQISNALKGEDTPPAAQIDGGLVRDPATGQFVPKPVVDPNAPAAAAPGTTQYPQQGIPGLDATTFATLPAETQQHVARTMETLNQQASQYAAYSQIEQVIAPRRQGWALNGISEAQAVNQLFALSDYADKDPAGFIRYIAEQRGLDLEDVAFGPEPVDPVTAALQKQVHDLSQQLGGITTQQQQAAHQNIVNEIVAFANEKGADGKTMLRPYFAELGNDVLPFIQQGMAQNPNRPRTEILTEAYERASWANPSVRAKMQAALDATREAERLRASTAAASKARVAGVSVAAGTPGDGATAVTPNTNGSLRDTIKASMAAST